MSHDTRDGLQDHDMLERARRARVDAEVTAAAGVTRAYRRDVQSTACCYCGNAQAGYCVNDLAACAACRKEYGKP